MLPVLNISPTLSLPTYYIVLSITACIALLWVSRRSLKKDLSQGIALDLSLLVMISGFLGGRLFHVLYEEPQYYAEDPWRIIEFWRGGFVYYGGFLLATFAGLFYLRRKAPHKIFTYLDLFSPVAALSYSLGRVGCLLEGCCYGRYCELPWAISQRHPTQVYASLWELGVVFILIGFEKTKFKSGQVFFLWISLHALGRLLMESFRDDFRGPFFLISISSWLSLILLSVGIVGLIMRRRSS